MISQKSSPLLVAIYAIFAAAATARALFQLLTKFDEAPIAYSLSAVSALTYILVTIALISRRFKLARKTMLAELIGVLVVGTLSIVLPATFHHASVWSLYGAGYGMVPLALPIWGLLSARRASRTPEVHQDLAHLNFPSAITIGKFDGVHLGHQKLLSTLVAIAKAKKLTPIALTFDRHPDALFRPDRVTQSLVSSFDKFALIGRTGVNHVVNLEFNQALASLSAREFVTRILCGDMNVKCIVIGQGFRFGAGGEGTVSTLRELAAEHGFEVIEVEPVLVDGEPISSTRIKNLLAEGDVVGAAALLGRRHRTVGHVVHGKKLGRELGFPTANLSQESQGFYPKDGVYAGWLFDSERRYPAAISVGTNETFDAVPRLVEAHVIDKSNIDLYDKEVTVEYLQFIRSAEKFDGVESLITAIHADIANIKAVLKKRGTK